MEYFLYIAVIISTFILIWVANKYLRMRCGLFSSILISVIPIVNILTIFIIALDSLIVLLSSKELKNLHLFLNKIKNMYININKKFMNIKD